MSLKRGLGNRLTKLALASAAVMAMPVQAADNNQINTAIDRGLGYLASSQAAGGYWNYGGYEPAVTGAAAYAMLSQQAQWGANASGYQDKVDAAMRYLLNNATKTSVSTRNDGVNICPGGAGSCSGVYWNAANNEDSYTTGLIAPALALYAKQQPNLDAVATASGALAGMTWRQIAQGVTNLWAASQSTANQGALIGGWRYMLGQGGYDSDMSTTQWGAISLTYMESLGAVTPAILKTDLAKFLAFTQNPATGVGCYQGPGSGMCDHADTGGLLMALAFTGKTAADPAVQKAIGYLQNNWTMDANNTWYGNFGHPYAMWGEYKGLETLIGLDDTTHVTNLHDSDCMTAGTTNAPTSGVCNWWQDYNEYLVRTQGGNGSWGGYDYWTGTLATAFYLPILGGTQIPIPPTVPEPGTVALVGLALVGLAASRRGRKG
jgi:hypothetical protein